LEVDAEVMILSAAGKRGVYLQWLICHVCLVR
jgi:hypothetical protein